MNEKVLKSIEHERRLAVAFNYAYEVIGEGLVSDAIYEYGLSNLKYLKRNFPTEWEHCDVFSDYFIQDDSWEYTGSGVPQNDEAKAEYDRVLKLKGK